MSVLDTMKAPIAGWLSFIAITWMLTALVYFFPVTHSIFAIAGVVTGLIVQFTVPFFVTAIVDEWVTNAHIKSIQALPDEE